MASIKSYKRSTVIKRIEDNLNEINRDYFEGNHGILSVTDSGDYVTVKNQSVYIADYDTQKLFDALENFSEEDFGFLFPYDLWDYLDHCKYTPEELKSNQAETKPEPQPEPQPEPKPTTKKRPKFKLPENFADYQQECDDLVNALSCFYNIKKGKWNGNILQFILTPTDSNKANQLYPYPHKWKAGLYLQPGQWAMDKVCLSDPDDWEDWFMDINDFADANGIEIS